MSVVYKKKIMLFTASIFILTALVVFIVIPRYSACKPEMKPDIPTTLSNHNLIIILIDSLRADHLGCYGYPRNTSPFIDSLAKQGMVFENFFSNSSFTRESVSVLFTGRLPSSSGSTGWRAAPPKTIKNIGMIFKDAGYKTGIISVSVQVKHPNFRMGFDHFECLSNSWGLSRGGPKLTARALDFIQKNKHQKFMLYLHYLDPHGPYDPPPEFYRRFKEKPYPHPIKIYGGLRQKCYELIKKGFGPGNKQFDDMVLRYDAEIAHTDYSIKLLFQGLKKENLLKNTAVVIIADHGEEFLEHNYVEHAWTLYNESLHIPLIFWAPGIIPHKRITTLVSTVDLLPTLAQLMGIAHQRKDLEGTPLFQYRKNGFFFNPPEKPFIAELLIQHRNLIRTIIKDDWKYISAQKWLLSPQRPMALKRTKEIERNKKLQLDTWGEVKHEELYHLAEDPGEKHNLLGKYKKIRKKFKQLMRVYKIYCKNKGIKNIRDENNKTPLSEEDAKILKSLGYL